MAGKPLLQIGENSLTLPEKVMLNQLTLQPGFKVLVKLIEAACKEANEDVVKTDPEAENYNRLLEARQQYSRALNKFSKQLRDSVDWHIQDGISQERQKEFEVQKLLKPQVVQSKK